MQKVAAAIPASGSGAGRDADVDVDAGPSELVSTADNVCTSCSLIQAVVTTVVTTVCSCWWHRSRCTCASAAKIGGRLFKRSYLAPLPRALLAVHLMISIRNYSLAVDVSGLSVQVMSFLL